MSWLSTLFDEYTQISLLLPVNTVRDMTCQSDTPSCSLEILSQQFAPLHSCMSSSALAAGHIREGKMMVTAQFLLVHRKDLVFTMQQIIATRNTYLLAVNCLVIAVFITSIFWHRSLLVEIEDLFEHRTVIICFVFYCANAFHTRWVVALLLQLLLLLWCWRI